MSDAPCVKCGRPTSRRQQDPVRGEVVAVCDSCCHRTAVFRLIVLAALAAALMVYILLSV
jgi:hypothetical protein